MRALAPGTKFLHCLPQYEYLELALRHGMMLTDHDVKFTPTEDRAQLATLVEEILPLIKSKLAGLGMKLESLTPDRTQMLFAGLGAMRGSVPMICMTEVPSGRLITEHRRLFGSFGLVLRQSWIEKREAERIIYAGHNSPASKILFRCLATMHILGLHVDQSGLLLFDSTTYKAALPLLSYFETRDHVSEAEWRIAGSTGYLGEKRNTGERLPLSLDDVEFVFLPNGDSVGRLQAVVDELAVTQHSSAMPRLLVFPDSIPV